MAVATLAEMAPLVEIKPRHICMILYTYIYISIQTNAYDFFFCLPIFKIAERDHQRSLFLRH